ncbi:hypothetical protein [Pseudoruegeria sp. SHC-113]|uniref:hypothetical protein n=1 Tax=Pseudoruegeria sp. SHC-113 TaxID=2855439 RepID=UPI0021BB5DC7|nr:hypothetical protein [Pseudoruegeria sp. SHC-113]MCT8160658.1 hypothetical protein [Pseudoruegeria sp. SHC-113]
MTDQEIRKQLERILNDRAFQASVRRREMLLFIVDETLAGRESTLKATTIAMAVFDRGADFDQQADPVVRLEARKLRRDLDTYYVGPGRDDPVRISIPKGHYIPKFEAQPSEGAPSEPDPEQPEIPPETENASGTGKGARLMVAVFAIAALVGVAVTLLVGREPATSTAVETDPKTVTLLVDAFEARGSDATVALVSSGLTSDVAAALIKFPDLAVHAVPADPAPVQATSHVVPPKTDYRVEGAVWRDDTALFVQATLVRADDFEVLWSERFMEGLEGQSITAIRDHIAVEIASTLGQQHGHVLRDVRAKKARRDPSLRGFACVASAQIYRRTYSNEEYPAVRACLEATVREDPGYVRAWAMLAYLRNDAVRFGHETALSREEGFALARAAALRGLNLDPEDTDVLQALSHVEQYSGDIERSIDYARKAVEINPNDPAALANLALRYGIAGRFDEGVPIMEQALERSVAPPPFYFHLLAAAHLLDGEWTSVVEDAERASTDGWSFGPALLAIAHHNLSNAQAARRALERVAALDPLLYEDPEAWLNSHSMAPILAEAVAEGLMEAKTALR